jgi:hypothetical protein
MVIQENCRVAWPAICAVLFAGLAAGCAGAVRTPSAPDLSELPPRDLLAVFLDNDASKGAVKFNFSGDIELEEGIRHSFRGLCGYDSCTALRVKLLGPLGFTILDYVNSQGEAALVVNQLTEEGDDEARESLLELMEVFSLALLDRCRPAIEFEGGPYGVASVNFTLQEHPGISLLTTLDRRRGVVTRQEVTSEALPGTVIDYLDYGWNGEYWLPGAIEVRGTGAPVSIRVAVKKWSIGVDFPDRFFAID